MSQDFQDWLAAQDIHVINTMYQVYQGKPKGAHLSAVTAHYTFTPITDKEITKFAKQIGFTNAKEK